VATNRVYAANTLANNVTVITEQPAAAVPLTVSIGTLAGNFTSSATPAFSFATSGSLPARKVYYQLDSWQGPWTAATGTAPSFTATPPALSPGAHILYAFASDGEDATLAGLARNPFSGPIAAYTFTYGQQAPPPSSGRLINISTRGRVETGESVMIGGFIIGGTAPKKVLITARGPSLANYGVTGVLANPLLQLYVGQSVIAANDDWQSNPPAMVSEIQATGIAPGDPLEAALMVTLNPGAYTAIVSGSGGGTGVGIVEVFEEGSIDIPLVNISTRGKVLTGENVMIGGFVILGDTPRKVLITARGPSLANYGVIGALANPALQLFSGQSVIAANDDWQSNPPAMVAEIQATGIAPGNSLEAALMITLDPGAYTAIVSGVGGGTGVGIVEVFAQ
jgi:hypothetical protein